jgi:hypothetical protein
VPGRCRSDAVAIIDAASLIHARWVLRSAGLTMGFAEGHRLGAKLSLPPVQLGLMHSSIAECVRTLKQGGCLALSWWDDPRRQRIQGLFREAIAEIGAAPPPDVPAGYSILRFSDTDEFRRLLEGAGHSEVAVHDHRTTHLVADVGTLWCGALGSFAVIAHQHAATRAAIRAALERKAAVYQTPNGLMLPIAFKIGVGRKPG